jgi:drug/metabolite transporter (DMT)-like permease
VTSAFERRGSPDLALIMVTVIWGGTFLVSQAALQDGGPYGLLTVRFTIGAAVLAFVIRAQMGALTREEIRTGTLLGVVTFASYAFQTVGLQHIASSRSAFITALYVPTVPILQLVLLKSAPRASAWIGIAVSFTGLLFLSSDDGFSLRFGFGESLTLAGALMSALQIVLISRYAPSAHPLRLAVVQLTVVALISLASLTLTREGAPPATSRFLVASLALGVFGTALALGAMNWAQQTISATKATIIYAMEPVWAGIFGALAGEVLTRPALIGSALIVLGVIVSEIRWQALTSSSKTG